MDKVDGLDIDIDSDRVAAAALQAALEYAFFFSAFEFDGEVQDLRGLVDVTHYYQGYAFDILNLDIMPISGSCAGPCRFISNEDGAEGDGSYFYEEEEDLFC